MYDTVEETRQKLESSIVLYDGHPAFVTGTGGRKGAIHLALNFLRPFNGDALPSYNLSDPKLDCWSVGTRLGYVNFNRGDMKQAIYVRRTTVRNTHGTQGLSGRNVEIDRLKPYRKKKFIGSALSFEELVSCEGFIKTIKRTYPSVSRCRTLMGNDEDVFSVAFSPSFAIRRTQYRDMFCLDYKGTEIGLSEDLERFKITPEFKYVKNDLANSFALKVA